MAVIIHRAISGEVQRSGQWNNTESRSEKARVNAFYGQFANAVSGLSNNGYLSAMQEGTDLVSHYWRRTFDDLNADG
jgi:hypothetical protein